MNWATIKNALQAWFATAIGLSSTKVIWAGQNSPRPAYPYGLLKITSTGTKGRDENRYTYSAGGGTDADMLVAVVGNRPFMLNCQVLNAPTDSAPLGHQATAQHYLGLAQTSLGKQTALDTLAAGGAAYLSRLPILDLDEVVDGRFISRGSMDVAMMAVENATDTATTYIKTTKITGTLDDTVVINDETFGDLS